MSGNALVISGGGSKGAFAVGAIFYILEKVNDSSGNPIKFSFVAGTSTGSLIAPAIGLHTLGVAGILTELRNIYTQTVTEQVLSIKNPPEILTTDSIFGTGPLEQLIRNFYTEDRFDVLQASTSVRIVVTTVNMTSGLTEFYYVGAPMAPPMPAEATIIRVTSYEQFVKAVLASASEPVMMPLVMIPGRDGKFTDGGVNSILPLSVALHFGFDSIYGISLSTRDRLPWPQTAPTTPIVLMRLLDVLLDNVLEYDIRNVQTASPGSVKALIYPPEDIEKHVDLPSLQFDPVKMLASYQYGYDTAKVYFQKPPSMIVPPA